MFPNLSNKKKFHIVCITPPGLPNPAIAIAASRASGIGILDLEFTNDLEVALDAIDKMDKHARHGCGIKLNGEDDDLINDIAQKLPGNVAVVIITFTKPEKLCKYIDILDMSPIFYTSLNAIFR